MTSEFPQFPARSVRAFILEDHIFRFPAARAGLLLCVAALHAVRVQPSQKMRVLYVKKAPNSSGLKDKEGKTMDSLSKTFNSVSNINLRALIAVLLLEIGEKQGEQHKTEVHKLTRKFNLKAKEQSRNGYHHQVATRHSPRSR